ncbi:MAG: nuclear transport factor 2 family protein [Pseudomonadota bacterium]
MPLHLLRSSSDSGLLQALGALVADYWYDVDHHWGRNAHQLYTPEGVFAIGDDVMDGPAAVQTFYKWREGRGAREARHVTSNLRVVQRDADHADLDCILCLYAADGTPVLPSSPPILIADEVAECVRGSDGLWRFKSHFLKPVFKGGAPITTPSGAKP